MNLKNLDIKTITIIVLAIALIISFMFGQKSHIDNHADEINALHKSNKELTTKNDSLAMINILLDAAVTDIKKELESNAKKLSDTQLELDNLKKKQNEVHNYVNHLSGNDVTNAFSDYLQGRTKNSSGR